MTKQNIWKTLNLLRKHGKKITIPSFYIQDISRIDFQMLRRRFSFIIFDKDNTLTMHHSETMPDHIKPAFLKCLEHFGSQRIICLTNDPGNRTKPQLPVGDSKLNALVTSSPKPLCYKEVQAFLDQKNLNRNEVLVIGDRILTDIMLGNLVGCKSLLTRPFETRTEKLGIRMARMFENFCFRSRVFFSQSEEFIKK